MTLSLCSCIICKKELKATGIHSHFYIKHTEQGKENHRQKGASGAAAYIKNIIIPFRAKYSNNPIKCKQCGSVLPYEKRFNVFCNSSCAAVYTNKHCSPERKRGPDKQPPKEKISNIVGVYSKLFRRTCKHCQKFNLVRRWSKYCDECAELYSHNGRAKYWFSFNVFHYPELFDLTLINKYGFRSLENPNGITRDHKVSVNDAIRNNYDPYYITHPMNCELMLFNDNNKKHTKSSITYEQLIDDVNQFNFKTSYCHRPGSN